MDDKNNGGEIYLEFGKDDVIRLEVLSYNTGEDARMCESVSKIMPLGDEVLIAEHGYIGLLTILNSLTNNEPVRVKGALTVVGVGHKVPEYIKLGMNIIPRSIEEFAMRKTIDPNNHYSYESLVSQARKDKHLLAAVSIANDAAQSKVGLNMVTTVINPKVIEDAENLAKQRSGNLIFKDKSVQFVNYVLTNSSNISAIIV